MTIVTCIPLAAARGILASFALIPLGGIMVQYFNPLKAWLLSSLGGSLLIWALTMAYSVLGGAYLDCPDIVLVRLAIVFLIYLGPGMVLYRMAVRKAVAGGVLS